MPNLWVLNFGKVVYMYQPCEWPFQMFREIRCGYVVIASHRHMILYIPMLPTLKNNYATQHYYCFI